MKLHDEFDAESFLENLISQADRQCWDISAFKDLADGLTKVLEELKTVKASDFQEIGDYLYDGIYIADGTGKTLYINAAYTRITGIKPDEVIGKNVADIVAEGLFKNAVTPEVIKNKKQVNAMAEIAKNGAKLLVTGIPIFNNQGEVKKVVVIDREITDLWKMKADLEASQKQMKAVEADREKSSLEVEHLRKMHLNKNLLGKSFAIQQVIKAVHQVAELDVTVLITGETGAGKEVVANEIYTNSLRRNGPFIKINCAAIPASLLEAELFGYAKGAFTGATASGKLGMFELADKGTLLLDEIGEMSMELQAKLLRVIQHKEVTRIGGTKPIKLDVRLLSSTNCDLKELVKKGGFREDLYYRLHVFPLYIPPLRERAEDIEILTRHFLALYNQKYGKRVSLESASVELLKQYAWPGNIRELQNVVERLIIVSEQIAVIGKEQVGSLLNIHPTHMSELGDNELGLRDIVDNIERMTIKKTLALYGSTRKAAKILKIEQSTLVKKAKRLGIAIKDEKSHQ